MKLMKIFFRVPLPLVGLPLLLSSFLLVASDQLRGGGFAQAAANGQPIQGQILMEGQQMPLVGMQQPALQQQQQPQGSWSTGELLQVDGSSAAGNVAVPAPAPNMMVAGAAQPPMMCQCEELGTSAQVDSVCSVSKVTIHQDHAGNAGMTLAAVSAVWGSSTLSSEQRDKVTLGKVSETSFSCLDDRVTKPSLFTPGGDLGEFILALASYLQERDPTGRLKPSQEVVDALLQKYLSEIPSSRPMLHCTDDRAIQHLEAELPLENLDLSAPPDHAMASLLQKLTEVENHGDSHIRLLLKKPEWFQVSEYLVPMAVKAFYHLLWQQNTDPKSPLYQSSKLKLEVLVGQSDPMAFLEVSSGELCHSGGVAPMLTPRSPQRAVLISHLDAVSLRRQELAAFFSRIANSSPRKINKDQLHQRMDRHGWLALETTGSRIAAGLPFYTLSYA